MVLTGKISGMTIDYKTGRPRLELEINERGNAMSAYDEFNLMPQLSIEIKKYRTKRSLDANAYAWELMTQMANILRVSKDEIYLTMLKRYGQGGVVKLREKDLEKFKLITKYVEKHEGFPDESGTAYYRFWVGSSQYNTEEMSILIDGIVSDAKELGIQTATPDELSRYLEEWQ